MDTPNWAQQLIKDNIDYLNSKGYTISFPDINWRKPTARRYNFSTDTETKIRRKCSSGICYKDHITICAGSDRKDCKLVILHEIAHWARPDGEHHSQSFWKLAWELYRRNKLPIRYCLNREKDYRKGAIKAYKGLNKGG